MKIEADSGIFLKRYCFDLLFFREDLPSVAVKDKRSVFAGIGHPMRSLPVSQSDAYCMFPYHRKVFEIIHGSHCIGCDHIIIGEGIFPTNSHN